MDGFMKAALDEARAGAAEGGIPIGAALVDSGGRLVATGRNRRLQDRDCVMHGEINCLNNAGKSVQDFRGMTMYSTLMPCSMCAGAIVLFGINKVVAAESESYTVPTGHELMLRNGVEVIDLDLDEAKQLMGEFMEQNPLQWARDSGQE
ncbi:MAG: nucleoside deaminase [Chloroflexi bacterium]|nr:nucleoside deaminase [Chloroflexota bacterium]